MVKAQECATPLWGEDIVRYSEEIRRARDKEPLYNICGVRLNSSRAGQFQVAMFLFAKTTCGTSLYCDPLKMLNWQSLAITLRARLLLN